MSDNSKTKNVKPAGTPELRKPLLLAMLKNLPGCALIPLNRPHEVDSKGRALGKSPLHKNWTKRAYNNPAKVIDFCIKTGRNIGIRLSDKVVVIDADPRNYSTGSNGRKIDGYAYVNQKFEMDEDGTAIFKTGGGGKHAIYYVPEDRAIESIRHSIGDDSARGVEIRHGQGQQIVAPGSRHPNGNLYAVSDDHPSLADALPRKIPATLRKAINRPKSEAVTGGGQYDQERIARGLAKLDPANYRDHDKWFPLMQSVHHASGGAARDEFIEWSTSDAEFADDGDVIGRRWDTLDPNRDDGVTYKTFEAELMKAGALNELAARDVGDDFDDDIDQETLDMLDKIVTKEKSDKKKRLARFAGISLDQIRKMPPLKYLLEGIIPAGSFFELYGKKKSGKTFWAISLGLCMATKRDFYGKKVTPGRVLHIVGEGNVKSFGNRVEAWLRDAAGGNADELKRLEDMIAANWRVVPVSVKMDIPAQVDAFLAANPGQWDLIIVDTLMRNVSGNFSDQEAMSKFVDGIDHVREKLKAALLVLHHPGHNDASRGAGSINLEAAVDGVGRFYRKGQHRIFEVRELRDADDRQGRMVFELQRVVLDAGGDFNDDFDFDTNEETTGEVSSAVLKLVEDGPPAVSDEDQCLSYIRDLKPKKQTEIVTASDGWDKHKVSGHVKNLREAGLVEADALKLTAAGEKHYLGLGIEEPEGDGDEADS